MKGCWASEQLLNEKPNRAKPAIGELGKEVDASRPLSVTRLPHSSFISFRRLPASRLRFPRDYAAARSALVVGGVLNDNPVPEAFQK